MKMNFFTVRNLIWVFSFFLLSGCVNSEQRVVSHPFPKFDTTRVISVFSFENYTDTPQAGERAANLMEGILSAKGYTTVNMVNEKHRSLSQKRQVARKNGYGYLLIGGVTEWRYKTGIDGEPAVSLQMKLIDAGNGRVLWSAAGSDNNWGNASIGTTAQELFESLLK